MAKKIGYSGFDSLNASIDDLEKGMKKVNQYGVTAGIHSDVGEYKDKEGNKEKITIAEVAAIQEYGNDHIPERSFFRSTIKEMTKAYQAIIVKILKKVVEASIKGQNDTSKHDMGELGQKVVNDIQAKIVAIKEPPNAPSTIKQKKGVNNPLVDTDQMLRSVRWKYSKKEPKDD